MFYYADSVISNQFLTEKIEVENETKIIVERLKVSRPFHFTPPEEDLSDENPKLKKKQSEKIKEKQNNTKKQETNSKEKKEEENFFSDENFKIETLEEEAIEKKNVSNLSLKIRSSKSEPTNSKIIVQVENTNSKLKERKKKN